jgi:tetratricopeptide (TPR) repeat protein
VVQGRIAEAERLLLGLTRQNSDDAEIWLQLGELYFHQNPLLGRTPQQAVGAFQHALVTDPLNTEAVSHLTDLAQLRGDRALVARLADRLLAISDDQAMTLTYRQALVWARGDASEHADVMASLREPGLARIVLTQSFVRAGWQLDDGKDAAQIASVLVKSEAAVERSYAHRLLGIIEFMHGRPAAGRAEYAKAVAENPTSTAAYFAGWCEAADFVPADAGQLAAARAAAARLGTAGQANLVVGKPYLIGVLAARAGDFPAAEVEARELERMAPIEGSSITADLALAVRARVLAARGEYAASLALLDKQELRVPARYAVFHWRISESWLRASLLESLGRPREALPLYDVFNFYNSIDPAFAALAQLRKARLLETIGDTEGAIAHYARFVDLWKDCEPSQKPELERARSQLEKLREQAAVRAAR